MLIFTYDVFGSDAEVMASMGQVMLDAASRHCELFGEEFAGTLVKHWQIDGVGNVIAQAKSLD